MTDIIELVWQQLQADLRKIREDSQKNLARSERAETAGGIASALFAALPYHANGAKDGDLMFVTDACKSGEGVGSGTGTPCYFDEGTDTWKRVEDDQAPLSAGSGGGGGGVTNVTASSPLASTGGATPNISLANPVPLSLLTDGATAGVPLLAGGGGGDPAYGALNLAQATAVTGALPLANVTDGATAGVPLLAGGAGGDPNYGQLALDQATAVKNVLPIGNGGTGASSLTGHGAAVINSGGTALSTVAPGSSGNVLVSNGTDWISSPPSVSGTGIAPLPGGRLTLTSGNPLVSTDQLDATSVYYTPYLHPYIELYDGAAWVTQVFSEFYGSVPTTQNTNYDVFVYLNSGTPTLEFVAWTNDTTRATALAYTGSRLVKYGDATRRYVGTIRTNGSTVGVTGHTDDSVTKRFVWNYYNREPRALYKASTASHTYNSTTERAWNNDSTNLFALVIGLNTVVDLGLGGSTSAGAFGGNTYIGTSVDGGALDLEIGYVLNYVNNYLNCSAAGYKSLAAGYHTVLAIESGAASVSSFTNFQLKGKVMG